MGRINGRIKGRINKFVSRYVIHIDYFYNFPEGTKVLFSVDEIHVQGLHGNYYELRVMGIESRAKVIYPFSSSLPMVVIGPKEAVYYCLIHCGRLDTEVVQSFDFALGHLIGLSEIDLGLAQKQLTGKGKI